MDEYNCNYSAFDIESHKSTYINYLECIIHPDGLVEYAHPSHQIKLAKIACDKLNIDEDTLWNDYVHIYDDVIYKLSELTGCISVWNNFFMGINPNELQVSKLLELKSHGIYNGGLVPSKF